MSVFGIVHSLYTERNWKQSKHHLKTMEQCILLYIVFFLYYCFTLSAIRKLKRVVWTIFVKSDAFNAQTWHAHLYISKNSVQHWAMYICAARHAYASYQPTRSFQFLFFFSFLFWLIPKKWFITQTTKGTWRKSCELSLISIIELVFMAHHKIETQ